jgi:hypothetical protein
MKWKITSSLLLQVPADTNILLLLLLLKPVKVSQQSRCPNRYAVHTETMKSSNSTIPYLHYFFLVENPHLMVNRFAWWYFDLY